MNSMAEVLEMARSKNITQA